MLTRKIMLLGDIAVGKTALARRLVFDQFEAGYKATLGVDIYSHVLDPQPVPDTPVKLSIWDIDGDLSHGIFSHNYMKGASGALMIGDATRPSTLNTIISLADTFRETQPGRPFVYVVNKLDLVEDGALDLPEALMDPEAILHQTSAMTGKHVNLAFADLAKAIVRIGA